ncbi:MAG: MmgE/PrpD family protein [Dehalobacterium sp.]
MGVKKFSEIMGAFIISADIHSFPETTLRKAKICLIDMLGVMIAAWSEESSRILGEYFISLNGRPESSIIVSGKKVPAIHASFINGAMAHSLELEDHHNHKRSLNHPGVASIPTALAIAEREGSKGKDFITSIILGYEIGSKISRATKIGVLNLERGFHESSVCGPFSSAAVAGKLMGMNTDQFAHAFGICGSLASGSMEFKVNEAWTKRLQVGDANRNGILAVELASKGFTGPATVFEGKHGFYNSYVGEGNYNLTEWLSDLGQDWEINYIQFKPFGCAGVLHSAVTAAQKMALEKNILPEQVKRITIHTSRKIMEEYAIPREKKIKPKNMVGAQFSLHYCVAAMIVKGELLYKELKALQDPQILDLAEKIQVIADPDIDKNWPSDDPTVLVTELEDGQIYRTRVEQAKGDLNDPILEHEIITKFHNLAGIFFSEKRRKEIIAFCLEIERKPDIGKLIKLLGQEN